MQYSREYVGLDVSLEETKACVVDEAGKVIWRGKCDSTPEKIEQLVRKHAPNAVRIGFETGILSVWHFHELKKRGLPVICIDARHAKAELSVQIKNTVRGLLKTFGILLPKGSPRRYVMTVRQAIDGSPTLLTIIEPMLIALASINEQIEVFDAALRRRARADTIARRLMTAPGVGVIVALSFIHTVEDPTRFGRSRTVGAYLGLTPKRDQSGEKDVIGKISRAGDRTMRGLLYEAAGVLLHRCSRPCALKEWGQALKERLGNKRATVAVARKLAVILHRMWRDGTAFQWQEPRRIAA